MIREKMANKAEKKNKKYKHTLINEDGLAEEQECTMYTYHVERMLAKQGIFTSNGPYPAGYENKTVESLLWRLNEERN